MKRFIPLLFMFLCLLFSSTGIAQGLAIRIGVEYSYPPFVFQDSLGHSYGFDIAMAEAICQQANQLCVFVPMPFDNLFTALKNNKVDAIISALYITPERKQNFDFTNPYYRSTMSYLANANSNLAITPQALKNKTVGVVKNTAFPNYLAKTYPGIQIKLFENTAEIIDALAKNQIDLALFDTPHTKWWFQHSSGQFKIIGQPELLPGSEGYGIAVAKGNTNLVNTLNYGLQKLVSSGKYNDIVNLYFQINSLK